MQKVNAAYKQKNIQNKLVSEKKTIEKLIKTQKKNVKSTHQI